MVGKIKKILFSILIGLIILFFGFMWMKEYNLKVMAHNLEVWESCINLITKMESPEKDFFDNCLKKFEIYPLF